MTENIDSFPKIKLRKDSAFLEEYQDETRYKVSLEYDNGGTNSVFVSESSFDELKEILSNRDDFQDTSYGPLRGVILLVGIGLLLLGVLFSLTLALLFVGVPIGGAGLTMITYVVNWEWKYEYTGENPESAWQELEMKFS